MKRVRQIAVITLVVLVQTFIVAKFTLHPVNLAKMPYRQTERTAALTAMYQHPSPENNAALQEEMQLEGRHNSAQQLRLTEIILTLVLGVEGVAVYLIGKHRIKLKAASTRDDLSIKASP